MRADRQRLDKWLWFARFARSRTLAAKLVGSGYVRVNGQRATDPAKGLAVGDVVTLALDRSTLVIRVRDRGTRRGPASEARLLYEDLGSDDAALVTNPDSG
ncbi:RNA-binding S4 domain-containing protein [Microvirga antarctica]|uniref:RNA-binding S4 domain-containing protein n=1 Tax=Microvirga antarctica TaxID=2819233 RepID=UPI001B30C6B5